MKDLKQMFAEGCKIIEDTCGDVIEDITDITINTRAQTRYGQCIHHSDGTHSINIAKRILDDNVPYNATMSVIVHEILHACHGGRGHKTQWKKYASAVMRAHPELTVTRTTSCKLFGFEPRKRPERKYSVQCERCGRTISRARQVGIIKNPENYTHRYCGGHFARIS